MTTTTLYIPVPDALHTILPGSGIVGTDHGERVLVDYEGNRYGSESFKTYADRCLHAAGRHVTNYPTIARAFMPANQLRPVGTFDDLFGEVHLDAGQEATLAQWLGVDTLDPQELLTTDRGRTSLRTVRAWSPAQREQLRQLSGPEREMYERAGLI